MWYSCNILISIEYEIANWLISEIRLCYNAVILIANRFKNSIISEMWSSCNILISIEHKIANLLISENENIEIYFHQEI